MDISNFTISKFDRHINNLGFEERLDYLSSLNLIGNDTPVSEWNEYLYINKLLNSVFYSKVSLNRNAALFQLPIDNSIADVVLLNDDGHVFEVKTNLDNLQRIDTQISDYYKAFNKVSILTSEEMSYSVYKEFKDYELGIYFLNYKGAIKCIKEPLPAGNIDFEIVYKILRKKEVDKILVSLGSELPTVSQFEYYESCKKIFLKLPKEKVYREFINALKKRNKKSKKTIQQYPYNLRTLVYFSKHNDELLQKIGEMIACTIHI